MMHIIGINPYYTSVDELMQSNELAQNDAILLKMKGVWSGQTVVYGPIWPVVCKVLSGLSMGNLFVALFIYKLFNLGLHLVNSYLIYKITNKKTLFTLSYALNPLLLFDGLSNVHNEVLVIFFILLGLYCFIRKKNMALAIISFAFATAVKYYAILIVPFIILYHYRNEKFLKKVGYSILWAILFIAVLSLCYLIYMKDFSILNGIFTQQKKLANSIFLCIGIKNIKWASIISRSSMLAFIIIYISTIIKLLFIKRHTFSYFMRIYSGLLMLFIFGVITNFQTWYILWLLPTIMWQSSKNIKWIMSITIIVEFSNIVFFILYEHFAYQVYYFIIMIVLMFLSNYICTKKYIGRNNLWKKSY